MHTTCRRFYPQIANNIQYAVHWYAINIEVGAVCVKTGLSERAWDVRGWKGALAEGQFAIAFSPLQAAPCDCYCYLLSAAPLYREKRAVE
jgi:hypothetical protein